MRVIQKGEGEPELAVIGSQHGDEPCGKRAIENLLDDFDFPKPVKFLIVNEEALEENQRYLEADINRSYPGDVESEKHEERLAASVLEQVEGMKVIDLHSTHSEPVPFVNFSRLNQEVLELVRDTGVERACRYPEDNGDISYRVNGITVESGKQGTEEASEMAYSILVNILSARGVIDGEFERSDPQVLEYRETVWGGDWEFLKENFKEVEEGEVFAKKGSTELVTTENFYPVLMSDKGYDDKLGHKAVKLGTLEMIEDGLQRD